MAVLQMNRDLFQSHLAESKKPVLVEYWAPWCSYCRRIAPALNKLADQVGEELVVAQINIDDESALADEERIEVIPTLVLYRDGQALGSIVAPDSKAKIDQFLRETLEPQQ